MNLIGEVEGKTAILVDDIVDTAGSLCEGAKAIERLGAKEIYAVCSHAILTDPAIERINASALKQLIVTDTIPLGDKKSDKIVVLTLADAIGDVLVSIQEHRSVSHLLR